MGPREESHALTTDLCTAGISSPAAFKDTLRRASASGALVLYESCV